MAKSGRPPLRITIDECKDFEKNRKKKDYRPGPEYPTVEEAKNMLKSVYTAKRYKISVIRIKHDGFLVVFKESDKTWTDGDGKMGGGPYGLSKISINWTSAKAMYKQYQEKKLKKEGNCAKTRNTNKIKNNQRVNKKV